MKNNSLAVATVTLLVVFGTQSTGAEVGADQCVTLRDTFDSIDGGIYRSTGSLNDLYFWAENYQRAGGFGMGSGLELYVREKRAVEEVKAYLSAMDRKVSAARHILNQICPK
jgi:hypothetical protein